MNTHKIFAVKYRFGHLDLVFVRELLHGNIEVWSSLAFAWVLMVIIQLAFVLLFTQFENFL